jgi:transcriptional regulator with XRE-family HTH domain
MKMSTSQKTGLNMQRLRPSTSQEFLQSVLYYHGLNQQELAHRLGVSGAQISRILDGQFNLSLNLRQQIAKQMAYDPGMLLMIDSDELNNS